MSANNRPSRCLSRALVVSLAIAAFLPAQQAPPWRVLREMEVTGSGYDRDDVAGVLATDFATMRALHRGLDQDTAEGIAERVVVMHRAGGYPDAKATAELVDGGLRIAVQPGSRYRWGGVRCSGNTALTEEQVATALTVPPRPRMPTGELAPPIASNKALLPVGQFANTTTSRSKRLQQGVVTAYENIGRYGASIKVAHEPDGDKLVLLVTVLDEGREVFLGGVQMDGEPDAETAAAVIAWAVPEVGMLATKAVRDRLRQRIEATARYAEVAVALPEPAPEASSARSATLIVNVVRIPEPPPFDASHLATAARLDHAMQRSAALLRGGELLQFGVEVGEQLPLQPVLTVHPGRIDLTMGTTGIHLEAEHIAWGDGPVERFALQVDPHGLRLVSGRSASIFAMPAGKLLSVQFQLMSTLHADGNGEIRWGLGTSTGDFPEFFFDMHPSFAAKLLRGANDVQHVDDDLVVRLGETTLRLGPAGEVRDQPIGFTVLGTECTVGLVSVLPNAVLPANDNAAAAPPEDALHKMLVAVLGQTVAHPTDRKRLRAMARGVIDAWPKPDDMLANLHDVPSLPVEGGQAPTMQFVFAAFVQQPCVRRGWSGQLVEACACASSYLAGDGRTASAALNELVEKQKAGPLLLIPLSMFFGLTNNPRHADALQELARTRWSFDAIWNDAADVLANTPSLADVPARAGAAFRKDPELQWLFDELPDGPAADHRAFRIAVRYWWSHGGESMLKQLLLD